MKNKQIHQLLEDIDQVEKDGVEFQNKVSRLVQRQNLLILFYSEKALQRAKSKQCILSPYLSIRTKTQRLD